MKFFALLALINFACFLPMFVLNFRQQPNPFGFLKNITPIGKATLRLFYKRMRVSDPFRINFDYTLLVLAAVGLGFDTYDGVAAIIGIVLAFGFIEILYSTVVHVVFKRPPSIASDLSLLKAGWSVAYNHRVLLIVAATALLTVTLFVTQVVTGFLLSAPTPKTWLPLAFAALLVPPCFYHWRAFPYKSFIWRVVYSPSLHLFRNLQFSHRTRRVLALDPNYFEQLNRYKEIELDSEVTIVMICVESYGSFAYDELQPASVITRRTAKAIEKLQSGNYSVASTFSEAPIFAGGSWLSFSTLTYGTRFDDAYLHDGLFGVNSAFGNYESLFHILQRNGYANNLLCPLGGGSSRLVDWASIDRCFRPQRKFDFDSMNFTGQTYDFFVKNDLYAPPDQYSLNHAYDAVRRAEDGPFSLFYCTLNSHYPWTINPEYVDDWRSLNNDPSQNNCTSNPTNAGDGYVRAIQYQLEYIFEFAADKMGDDLLMVVFGDHQPPLITPESIGKHTPLHVISRHTKLIEQFLAHGFAPTVDLRKQAVKPIRHEGFLSMLMQAMNASFGKNPSLPIEYLPGGTRLVTHE